MIRKHEEKDVVSLGYSRRIFDRYEAHTKRFTQDIMYKVEDVYNRVLKQDGEDDVMVSDDENPHGPTVYLPSTFKTEMDKQVE